MPNPPKRKQGKKKKHILKRLAYERRKNALTETKHEKDLVIFAPTKVNSDQTASSTNVYSEPIASTSTAKSDKAGFSHETFISDRITVVENLNINGEIIPHGLITIVGDGACLFRALSYVIYHTDEVFSHIRSTIVQNVANNWAEFSVLSHDEFGNNYKTAKDYFNEMSQNHVFGGFCELVAAGKLYPYCFEVYFEGKIYAKFGNESNPVRRLRFSGSFSNGHFDAYMPLTEISNRAYSNQEADRQRAASRLCRNRAHARETHEETKELIIKEHSYTSALREAERHEETERRRESKRRSVKFRRSFIWRDKEKEAFRYDPNNDYSNDPSCSIESMSFRCQYCAALKWKDEAKGMCCSGGKVLLPHLHDPPQLLYTLMSTGSSEATHFQKNIRQYNACFSMTSFGATKEIREPGYMPTFKIQGQVYHRIGSLYPPENEQAKFLQLYFIDDFQQQAQQRGNLFDNLNQDIILQLQLLLQQENSYVKSFKMAKEHITPEVQLLITADRVPHGEHERRFNVPMTSEVAVIISGETQRNRDIVLTSDLFIYLFS